MHTFAQSQRPPQKPKSSRFGRPKQVLGHDHGQQPLLPLPRAIGNQSEQPTLQAQAEEPKARLSVAASLRFGHDFSRLPIHPRASGVIQTKLAINQPGDEYEQEADHVSKQVMRMPEMQLQRTCACGGTCPNCQKEQSAQGHEPLQMKRAGGSDLGQTEAPPIVHEALRSPGQPLDAAPRTLMEQRFGHDFSGVRVHSGTIAEQSARDVNAQAYTVGRDIVFGAGEYRPSTSEGRSLLAHELAHVRQDALAGCPGVRLSRSPQPNPASQLSSSRAAVALGETDLRQVARRLNVDPDELLIANPQIKDPTTLAPGQVIFLPLTQTTYPVSENDPSPSSLKLAPTANPIASSVPKTNPTQKADPSSANEKVIPFPFGNIDVHALEQAVQELKAAHNIYLRTGKVPPTKASWSGIEIKTGTPMSRAERYDAMVKKLGIDGQIAKILDVKMDNRDPDYLTKEEFNDEFYARRNAEWDACDADHWFKGPTFKCQREVDAKYGGESFVAWRDARDQDLARRYREFQQKAEGVINSGAFSLAGRVVGRSVGGERGEQWGAIVGGMLDAAAVVYAGSKAPSADAYEGGAGLEVGLGTAADIAPAPATNPAETQPSSLTDFAPPPSPRVDGFARDREAQPSAPSVPAPSNVPPSPSPRVGGFARDREDQPSAPSTPVPSNAPPSPSPRVAGFARDREAPPPPSSLTPGQQTVTKLPPPKTVPSSGSQQGAGNGSIGQRRGEPTTAMAGKPTGDHDSSVKAPPAVGHTAVEKQEDAGGDTPPYEGPSVRKLKPTEAPPPGVPALTRQQAHLIEELRAGHDVTVPDLKTARALLANMPDIAPYTGAGRDPWETAPKGTYRGDLIDIENPAAPEVHPEGTAPASHRRNAHYNIWFPNGEKAAILILSR
jgi:hypothetical protein